MPWLAGASIVVVSLLLTDYAVRQRTAADLDNYVAQLLRKAAAVSQASKDVLDRARWIDRPACSEGDLNEMRLLSFSAPYVRDVGRLVGGRLLCSASWGVLRPAVLMPTPDLQRLGYQFWGGVSGVLDSRIEADMTAFEGVIVATSPRAFDEVVGGSGRRGAVVTVLDGQYTFERFGEADAIALSGAGIPVHVDGFITARRCDASVGVCVVGTDTSPGLVGLPLWQSLSVLFLSLMGGAGCGVQLAAMERKRRSTARQLVRALSRREVDVVYQPLRRLCDRSLVGVEALARWSDEDGKSVPPDEFIPIIERLQLTGALARFVFLKSLEDLKDRFRAEHLFYVSINLAAEDVLDAGLLPFMDAELSSRGIRPSQIVLEITERSTTGADELNVALRNLQAAGYRVFIDDFGTGYSNFSYLSGMPIGGLKMDRQFTTAIGADSVASQIAAAICAMTGTLGIVLVAEGVETEEQAQGVLELLPTAIGQGWLLGRPCHWTDLPAL